MGLVVHVYQDDALASFRACAASLVALRCTAVRLAPQRTIDGPIVKWLANWGTTHRLARPVAGGGRGSASSGRAARPDGDEGMEGVEDEGAPRRGRRGLGVDEAAATALSPARRGAIRRLAPGSRAPSGVGPPKGGAPQRRWRAYRFAQTAEEAANDFRIW